MTIENFQELVQELFALGITSSGLEFLLDILSRQTNEGNTQVSVQALSDEITKASSRFQELGIKPGMTVARIASVLERYQPQKPTRGFGHTR